MGKLKARVDSFAELCVEDYRFSPGAPEGPQFCSIDNEDLKADEWSSSLVGLSLWDPAALRRYEHIFTPWGRQQLLQHLGTRERWFGFVPVEQQIEELQQRVCAFDGYRIRCMRTLDFDDVRVIRGMVSNSYGDIPDTTVVDALFKSMGEGSAVISQYSEKTDRALYAYVCRPDERIGIPDTTFWGVPGVVVQNSEVGYASLRMRPMIFTTGAIVLEGGSVMRRIHRGAAKDLEKAFSEAMQVAEQIWSDVNTKISKLQAQLYTTEDEALDGITAMMLRAKAKKSFALAARNAYKRANNTIHTGAAVLEAVLQAAAEATGDGLHADAAYDAAAVAGGVLFHLLSR